MCSMSHSRAVAEPDLKPRFLDSQPEALGSGSCNGVGENGAFGDLAHVGVFAPQK